MHISPFSVGIRVAVLIASGAGFEVTGHPSFGLSFAHEGGDGAKCSPAGVELRSGAERIAGVVGDSPMPVFPDKRQRLVGSTGASQRTRNSPKSGVGLSVKAFHNPGR